MFSTTFWRFSLASLCLMVGSAFWSSHAAAQGSHEGSSVNSAPIKKQFAFEVVSIRPHQPGSAFLNTQYMPDGYKSSFRLEDVILQAYIPGPWKQLRSKILNAPVWIDDYYDIDARVAQEDMTAWQQAQNGYYSDSELLHSAWQAALRERCNLALHLTPIEVPYLYLMVGKHGAKLRDTVPGAVKPVIGKTMRLGEGFYIEDNGQRRFVGVSMEEFTLSLMQLTQKYSVQDKTGLTGRYDFTLPWYDYVHHPTSEIRDPLDRMPINSIGLMLKRGKGPGFIINIDHIEKPSPN